MHRTDLLRKLQAYRADYPDESGVIDRFAAFVAAHENCFERSLTAGHVTGSAWLVNQAGTRALLTHHKKLNRWLQLGGHADGNPQIHAVALREAREESGLTAIHFVSQRIFDVDIHLIPARGDEQAHLHYDARFALRSADERYQVSAESHALAWVEIGQIEALSDEEAMRRMARKWRAGAIITR